MSESEIEIEWYDAHREPQCEPNPNFPNGIDIDYVRSVDAKTCKVLLPYPAKRCGYYRVYCRTCGYSVLVTTAGRIDDPRSVVLPCMSLENGDHGKAEEQSGREKRDGNGHVH